MTGRERTAFIEIPVEIKNWTHLANFYLKIARVDPVHPGLQPLPDSCASHYPVLQVALLYDCLTHLHACMTDAAGIPSGERRRRHA